MRGLFYYLETDRCSFFRCPQPFSAKHQSCYTVVVFLLFRITASTFVLLATCILPVVASAHGSITDDEDLHHDIEFCLSDTDPLKRTICYDTLCAFDRTCVQSLVTAATQAKGPKVGIAVLTDFMNRNRRDVTGDGHDLAHAIGRATERTFGGTWVSYQSCPVEYFLGCQHGFFEAMLADSPDAATAAKEICADALKDQRSFCFHGMGHGLLMSTAYDVQRALDACDQLDGNVALQGCYTGVFMENVNAQTRGQARTGMFRADDLLSPCNRLAEKYKTACYAQHADYLLSAMSGSLIDTVHACDPIPHEDQRIACVRHLGQNMSTLEAQTLFGLSGSGSVAEHALTLCNEFPPEFREICYDGADQNFFLYDHVEAGIEFCHIASWEPCWDIVATYAVRSTFPPAKRSLACGSLPSALGRFACRHPSAAFAWQCVWPLPLAAGFVILLWRMRRKRNVM